MNTGELGKLSNETDWLYRPMAETVTWDTPGVKEKWESGEIILYPIHTGGFQWQRNTYYQGRRLMNKGLGGIMQQLETGEWVEPKPAQKEDE